MDWISVTDRLPKPYENVILTDGKKVSAAYHNGNRVWRVPEVGLRAVIEIDTDVTHWQPLPEPPTTQT